jgi:CheY-like chemotaxis protein
MKVLVVEDNPLNLKLFCETLKMKGFEVITARNGLEAIEILKTTIPNLILLDLYMPGMSGFRLANFLSKEAKYAHIPIIVVSASSSVYDVKEMASYNVKAYLVKPVSPTKLLETVKKVIISVETEGSYRAFSEPKTQKTSSTTTENEGLDNKPKQTKEVEKKVLDTGIRVFVDNLIEGMVLGAPVERNKVIIYREGTTLDEGMIAKLKELGIKEVYISKESYESFKEVLELGNEKEEF